MSSKEDYRQMGRREALLGYVLKYSISMTIVDLRVRDLIFAEQSHSMKKSSRLKKIRRLHAAWRVSLRGDTRRSAQPAKPGRKIYPASCEKCGGKGRVAKFGK